MKPTQHILYITLFLAITSLTYAIPIPHGVDGTIYKLDGITPVDDGVSFTVTNLNTGKEVSGVTGRFGAGRYSVSMNGEDGDTVIIKAFTNYNQVNRTETLESVLHNVDLLLNDSIPAEQQQSLAAESQSIGQQSNSNTVQSASTTSQTVHSQLTTITNIDPPVTTIQITEGVHPVITTKTLAYKYFELSKITQDVNIEFKVTKEWINRFSLEKEDIQLYYYSNDWKEIKTTATKETKQFIFFTATIQHSILNNLNTLFAISVKQDTTIKQPEPQSSSLRTLYRVSGIFYDTKDIPVKKNTEFIAENTRTSEIVIGKTGMGPISGAYLFLLHGRKDDVIEIQMNDKLFYTTLEDKTNLHFTHNNNPEPNSITGNVVHVLSSSVHGAAVGLLVIAIMLLVLMKHQTRLRSKKGG